MQRHVLISWCGPFPSLAFHAAFVCCLIVLVALELTLLWILVTLLFAKWWVTAKQRAILTFELKKIQAVPHAT
jgi:hypothetical protein